ncbi:hypothetical protein quinque_007063 [Culex quinquefasciatus]
MSFQTVSSALVLSLVALASSSSATKNSTSDISSRAGFANSCRAHGLRLASVHSALDNVKLMAALAQKDINQRGPWWIAGTDLGRTGNFVWITSNKRIDGRSGYTNFAAGEAKSACANEHCLVAGDGTGGTQWDSVSCDNRNGYICELDTCDC